MIKYSEWNAWFDLMPPGPPRLHVTARCAGLAAGQSVMLQHIQDVAAPPTIVGPLALKPGSAPPTFRIRSGTNRYYAVEVATDPMKLSPSSLRSPDNFYGTWQDGGFSTGPTLTLPEAVWRRLSVTRRLYYRVVTSASNRAWTLADTSKLAAEVASAPFVRILRGGQLRDEPLVCELDVTVNGLHLMWEPLTDRVVHLRYTQVWQGVMCQAVTIASVGVRVPVERVH